MAGFGSDSDRSRHDHDHDHNAAVEPVADADDRAVALLRDGFPELTPLLDALASLTGEPPGAQAVLAELAELAAEALLRCPDEDGEERLERLFGAVERLAAAGDHELDTVVAYAFLDGLGPGALSLALPYLGPATEALLDALDAGELAGE